MARRGFSRVRSGLSSEGAAVGKQGESPACIDVCLTQHSRGREEVSLDKVPELYSSSPSLHTPLPITSAEGEAAVYHHILGSDSEPYLQGQVGGHSPNPTAPWCRWLSSGLGKSHLQLLRDLTKCKMLKDSPPEAKKHFKAYQKNREHVSPERGRERHWSA